MVASLLDNRRAPLSMTPWGPAGELRARQLRPGPGKAPASVDRNQRERIYGATVATVAEHGYESTRVADIIALAGLSRSAFYRLFDNKLECFLATLDAIADLARAPVVEVYRESRGQDWRERLEAALGCLVGMILAQPAAARVWLVEIYAAGPAAVDRLDRVVDQLVAEASDSFGDVPGQPGMPPDGVRAVFGGLHQIIHTRLRHDREEELPELVPDLVEWALSYGSPPTRLRRPRKPPQLPEPTPDPDDQRRRILTATTDVIAEQCYQEMTITEISQRAAVSLTTFYNHFDSKQAAFVAALGEAERQVVEIAWPVFSSERNWSRAVRDAIYAFFAFNATHPALSRLGGLRSFSGGASGLARREDATARFASILHDGYRERPDLSPIVGEAVSGSLGALIYQTIARRGPEQMYSVAGIGSFLALAPFVGSDEACRLANEGWTPAP